MKHSMPCYASLYTTNSCMRVWFWYFYSELLLLYCRSCNIDVHSGKWVDLHQSSRYAYVHVILCVLLILRQDVILYLDVNLRSLLILVEGTNWAPQRLCLLLLFFLLLLDLSKALSIGQVVHGDSQEYIQQDVLGDRVKVHVHVYLL